MQEPTVSVIVTTYNREILLKETIQSILNQTYTDFELLVVDNCSDYDFFKVINAFNDPRIRPFQNRNYGIIAANRNFGIRQARGKYLAFCDDDDLWRPEKLEVQLRVVEESGVDVVCSNIERFSNNVESAIITRAKDASISLASLLYKNTIATSSVLVKNTSNVFFNESTALITVEDYELWIRLILNGCSIQYIGKPLVYYRVFSQNTSSGRNNLLLPIRRIYMLSGIKVKYNLSSGRYIISILINLLEFAAKKIIRR